MIKVTFTLDPEAVRELDRAAERLAIPKSQVVREALRVYGEQLGRLSEAERAAKLEAFDRLTPQIPKRTRHEVEAELDRVRSARRGGGRRSPSK
jgi:predicted transcriptional regulator